MKYNSFKLSEYILFQNYYLYNNNIIPYNCKYFNFNTKSLIFIKQGLIKINLNKYNSYKSINLESDKYLLQIEPNTNYNIISKSKESFIEIYYTNSDVNNNLITNINNSFDNSLDNKIYNI